MIYENKEMKLDPVIHIQEANDSDQEPYLHPSGVPGVVEFDVEQPSEGDEAGMTEAVPYQWKQVELTAAEATEDNIDWGDEDKRPNEEIHWIARKWSWKKDVVIHSWKRRRD